MKNFIPLFFVFLTIKSNAQYISLNFGGDDDWVTGTNNSLPQGNAPRTIETWVKYSTSRNDMSIFNYGTFSFNQKFTLHLYNGVYIIGEGNDLSTGYHFNDGTWHHLAVTHNGSSTIVYVDGIVRGTRNTTYNTTGFDYQMGVSLRNGSWDFRFEGNIDELRVWNVARSQQEIVDNMFTSISSASGLIASYHLNDGIPNGNNTAVITVQDASGNGNHGMLNNFALMSTSSNFVDDAAILPLRLLSFSAKENNCTAELKWHTADEINMLYFEIEESKNGIPFKAIEKQNAKNGTNENYYTASVRNNSGTVFYRLKMAEADGKITYSNTQALQFSNCNYHVTIQPNPAKNILFIKNATVGNEFRIYNTLGALIIKGIVNTSPHGINISKLGAGLYYVVTGAIRIQFVKE